MDIYFAASIRGNGGINHKTCKRILNNLKKHGKVFTEHICDVVGKRDFIEDTDKEIYERDICWLKSADALVAEVSVASLGVGYEIGKAEELGKKILCLYSKRAKNRLSAMIEGNMNLTLKKYNNIDEALRFIDIFLSELDIEGSR